MNIRWLAVPAFGVALLAATLHFGEAPESLEASVQDLLDEQREDRPFDPHRWVLVDPVDTMSWRPVVERQRRYFASLQPVVVQRLLKRSAGHSDAEAVILAVGEAVVAGDSLSLLETLYRVRGVQLQSSLGVEDDALWGWSDHERLSWNRYRVRLRGASGRSLTLVWQRIPSGWRVVEVLLDSQESLASK